MAETTFSFEGAGPAIAAGGYGLQAFAAIAQGIAAQRRAKAVSAYNAEAAQATAQAQAYAAENEAQQLERQSAVARQDQLLAQYAQGYRERLEREQHEAVLGQSRAIIAASGVMLSGSPLAVYEQTVLNQQRDILAQRYQTNLQVRASGEQATMAEYGATLARFGGEERLRVGKAQAGLIRAETDTSQVAAGLLRATGSLVQGAATYGYLNERQKSKSLLAGG